MEPILLPAGDSPSTEYRSPVSKTPVRTFVPRGATGSSVRPYHFISPVASSRNTTGKFCVPQDAVNLIGRSATASVLTRSSLEHSPTCHCAANTRNTEQDVAQPVFGKATQPKAEHCIVEAVSTNCL